MRTTLLVLRLALGAHIQRMPLPELLARLEPNDQQLERLLRPDAARHLECDIADTAVSAQSAAAAARRSARSDTTQEAAGDLADALQPFSPNSRASSTSDGWKETAPLVLFLQL